MELRKIIDRPDVDYTCYLEFADDGRVYVHNTVKKYSARTKREMLAVIDIIQEGLKRDLFCMYSLYDIPDHLPKYWGLLGFHPFCFDIDGEGRTSIVYRKEYIPIGKQ